MIASLGRGMLKQMQKCVLDRILQSTNFRIGNSLVARLLNGLCGDRQRTPHGNRVTDHRAYQEIAEA